MTLRVCFTLRPAFISTRVARPLSLLLPNEGPTSWQRTYPTVFPAITVVPLPRQQFPYNGAPRALVPLLAKRLGHGKATGRNEQEARDRLVPVGEVLRRIRWDTELSSSDFFILLSEKQDKEELVRIPLESSNTISEHGIVAVQFKERIVWDQRNSLDLVISPPGLRHVVDTYDEWKSEYDQEQAKQKQRQQEILGRVAHLLGGKEAFDSLKEASEGLRQCQTIDNDFARVVAPAQIETYVERVLDLVSQSRSPESSSQDQESTDGTSTSTVFEALSDYVSIAISNDDVQKMVRNQLSKSMGLTNGTGSHRSMSSRKLVELLEEDLVETFVRGSGPGGQKINKTSNRVVLVHAPTQLRVECQVTRSLTQNRKIARRRLREKLDEHWNGSQSKLGQKAKAAASKRQKTKSRNRARLRKKQRSKDNEID